MSVSPAFSPSIDAQPLPSFRNYSLRCQRGFAAASSLAPAILSVDRMRDAAHAQTDLTGVMATAAYLKALQFIVGYAECVQDSSLEFVLAMVEAEPHFSQSQHE